MRTKKILPYILLIVLALLVLTVKNCKRTETNQTKQVVKAQTTQPDNNNEAEPSARGLNRHPFNMHYSKHARCRMECRHIDESEIKDILEHGTINYRKSELQREPCRNKYAVEGLSKDGQKLRVIFAPCNNEMTVVTCIDLGVEWSCDCK
ncbi:MAG: DUF4258 domain-containing protein [Bacteroidota bacterium]